jgi:hypothetical protein
MAHANWAFRQVFGDRDSTEEPADGARAPSHTRALAAANLHLGSLTRLLFPDAFRHLCRAVVCANAWFRGRAEDLISAVQFDGTGDYLATGDRGGRVVIFESSDVTARQASREAREANGEHSGDSEMHSASKEIEYRFYCEFQSHEPEFDYLKSLEIEEKINRIRWRHGKAGPLFLLSTNGEHIQAFASRPGALPRHSARK